jgi:Zn2+/Cd2+-exporting ATPase
MAPVLVDYAQSNSVEPKSDNVTVYEMYPGEGIYGKIDGEGVYIGNKRILSRASCETGRYRCMLNIFPKYVVDDIQLSVA